MYILTQSLGGLFDELACAWFFSEPHLNISCKTVGLKLQGWTSIVASLKSSPKARKRELTKGHRVSRHAIIAANNERSMSVSVHPVDESILENASGDEGEGNAVQIQLVPTVSIANERGSLALGPLALQPPHSEALFASKGQVLQVKQAARDQTHLPSQDEDLDYDPGL
jgi:hypothetical protein